MTRRIGYIFDVLNYNNISKPQYPVDPENSMYIMTASASKVYPIRRVVQRKQT